VQQGRAHTPLAGLHTRTAPAARSERLPPTNRRRPTLLCAASNPKKGRWEIMQLRKFNWQRREAALLAEIITACALAWTSGTPS